MLEFFSTGIQRPDPDLIEMITVLGRQIGLFIERRQAEELLRDREVLLRESQAAAHIGSWEWDVQRDRITWSDEMYRLFGLEPRSMEITLQEFLQRTHPDDRELVESVLREAMTELKPFSFEHRVVWPDGSICRLHCRGSVLADSNGNPQRMTGIGMAVSPELPVKSPRRAATRLRELKNQSTPLAGA